MTEQKKEMTWDELSDEQKEVILLYRQATDEWKEFVMNFLKIATEQKGRGAEETLAIMRERNMATPEMLDRVKNILDVQKDG